MDLQNFLTKAFEEIGGIVEPLEYALCHVLIPEEYKYVLFGRQEALLAFDFEVAQENPGAEFITFGSGILDNVFEMIENLAVATTRYAVVDRLVLNRAEQKILSFLGLQQGAKLLVKSEKPVLTFWLLFRFKVDFVSDSISTEICEAWVDTVTGRISKEMKNYKSSIFYEKASVYEYPLSGIPDIYSVYKAAYIEVSEEAKIKTANYSRQDELDLELNRIDSYYCDLEIETKKRSERKGITPEKIQELSDKIEALKLEKEKQLKEIEDKFRVKTRITLDNIINYIIPELELVVEIYLRTGIETKMLYSNPVLKNFRIL